MLGNLQRNCQIEGTLEAKWFRQVGSLEAVPRNLEKASIDILTINPEYLLHAKLSKNAQPASVATAHIHHAMHREKIQDQRRHDLSGSRGPVSDLLIKALRIVFTEQGRTIAPLFRFSLLGEGPNNYGELRLVLEAVPERVVHRPAEAGCHVCK